ncbi:class I SAM-dependent methyltransferase [Aureibacter tunicatorum]|uniref:Ubiquinone/menaquinone biosynthesis C-methylase UbiE n=1 Tax=Aureibacter tunicatorum TaxID=866807 RepID=A0AAE4BTD8_9BACT|nr:class I SAM-dependent methyltransferase [Aureibacter tunicatorum]MDR6240686.1 ubiquinone/menaquinone biosynthesis C-methylase UbiE [Aureibacter tunicatorum]BDD06981.1 SAM-dependent methyltransferase [Aureibacter tunicatorum]
MTQDNNLWYAKEYQEKHKYIYQNGKELIKLLNPQKGEKILDLGCGTGELTYEIQQLGAETIGIDLSPEMITRAKHKFPEMNFRQVPAEKMSYHHSFDAVFSNETIHWVTNQIQLTSKIYNALKQNGRFIAEFGSRGNCRKTIQAIKKMLVKLNKPERIELIQWYFPSISSYTDLLEAYGLEVRYAEIFDHPTVMEDPDRGVIEWLHSFADYLFGGYSYDEKEVIFAEIQESLKNSNFREGKWYLDYKRMRVSAIKL